MADRSIYTQEAALREAEVIRLSIANPDATPDPEVGKIRLFDSGWTPENTSTKADLEDHETAMGGYPSGGYDVDEIPPAQLVSGGGAVITPANQNIAYSTTPGASLGGGWIEDSTGKVRQVYIFDPPRAVQSPGQGFLLIRQMGYGRNS